MNISLLKKDVVFVDARERKEYKTSHIENAIFVGYDSLDLTAMENIDKNSKLIFDQLDNFVSKPIFTFSLNYFSLVPYQFFTASGDQQIEISDIFDVKDLQNVYFLDDVVKLDFNAEIKNEFDREVSIVVEFFNKNNDVLYTFTPLVVESKVLDYIFLDEIKIASNPDILDTSKVKITITLAETGIPLNINDTSEVEFKSSVTLYIKSRF